MKLSLADGQVSSSASSVYSHFSSSGNTSATLTSLSLFNTSATQQTIFLYFRRFGSTTNRKIRRFVLAQNQHAQAFSLDDSLVLSPGDELLLETTTASVVDFVLGGIVE